MDNITHSLVGATLAETVIQVSGILKEDQRDADPAKNIGASKSTLTRPFIYLVSILASNFPDIDPLYTWITGGKLGYLIHHRGHTHTFLGVFFLWVILFLGVKAWQRRKKLQISKIDWRWMNALIVFGLCFHIFMDSWNPYGVHPFWPFSSKWFYGDAISILEPWLWLTMIPFFFLQTKSKGWKVFLGFVFLFGLAINGKFSEIPTVTVPILALSGLVIFWVHYQLRERWKQLVFSIVGVSIVVGGYFLTSFQVRNNLGEFLKSENSGYKVSDLVLFPMPANPLCWNFITVESNNTSYRMRNGVYSLSPSLIEPENCRKVDISEATADLRPVQTQSPPELLWFGEYLAPLQELSDLDRDHCYVRAALRFLRAPFWKFQDDKIIVGDLRFDFEKRLGFSEMLFVNQIQNCPQFVATWNPPVEDLIHEHRVFAARQQEVGRVPAGDEKKE